MQNPGLMSVMIEHVRFVNRKRWFRFAVRGRRKNEQSGFFDAHPRFLSTSKTAVTRDRLNGRYRALIESNADHIAGKRVLDITSHDGRWSLAASKAGARYVMGIEARAHLVAAARETMIEYGILEGRVEFTQGDLFVELDKLEARSFDTVFASDSCITRSTIWHSCARSLESTPLQSLSIRQFLRTRDASLKWTGRISRTRPPELLAKLAILGTF